MLRPLLHPCVLMLTSFSSFLSFSSVIFSFFPCLACQSERQLQWKRITISVDPFDWENIYGDGTKDACVQIVTPSNRSSGEKNFLLATIQPRWMYRTSIWMHKDKMQHHTHKFHILVLISNGERKKSHKSYWLCSFSSPFFILSFFHCWFSCLVSFDSISLFCSRGLWLSCVCTHSANGERTRILIDVCERACVRIFLHFVWTVKKCIMKKNNNPNQYGLTRTKNKWGEKKS